MAKSAKRNITVSSKPVTSAKPAATVTKPVIAATPSAVAVDKSASQLATRETRNADYLATATYPAVKLSPADRSYLAIFAASAKANNGTINLAALDIADRAAKRLVNNRARAHRCADFGLLTRTGDAASTSRFTFAPAITATATPDKASPNVLAVRTIYASAKAQA